ncbi:MAG: baseplate J/gp47 family protein [Oscillospiraceae bacterium]
MYKNITYESILQRMLGRVPRDVDKREGSIIYDALAPAAVELQLMYIELDVILSETFGDTASRDFLIRRAKERGINPKPATYAILKGEFNIDIPIGSRFSLSNLNYVAVEKIATGQYKMRCEVIGTVGNTIFGTLIPIDYIEGLQTANLTQVLIPGENEEETESIRKRYFDSFNIKPFGGNVDDYTTKTNSIAGVGATKVTPIWNGGGTVKLTILDSEFNKATPTLINTVQQAIDPTKDGQGLGVAPIGHRVTVDTATEVAVNITTTITFAEGYTWTNLKTSIENVIKSYLLTLRREWISAIPVVRVSQIESMIMGITGVVDIRNTTINGAAGNLTLTKYQIPTFGGVTNA